MTKENLIKRIEELSDYTHAFLSPEGANHFLKPFGLEPHLRIAKDTSHEFKGLTLEGNMKEAEGMDALQVASSIADHFKLNVPDYFGRGSQHRAYCEAIITHLKEKTSGEA